MGDDGRARDRVASGATLLGMSGSNYLPSLMADGPMLPSPSSSSRTSSGIHSAIPIWRSAEWLLTFVRMTPVGIGRLRPDAAVNSSPARFGRGTRLCRRGPRSGGGVSRYREGAPPPSGLRPVQGRHGSPLNSSCRGGWSENDQKLTFPTPLPSREGPGVGAPRSGGLRSIGQKLAALATHPNPSLEGRGYVLFPPLCVIQSLTAS